MHGENALPRSLFASLASPYHAAMPAPRNPAFGTGGARFEARPDPRPDAFLLAARVAALAGSRR
jgi:hypothetical protein